MTTSVLVKARYNLLRNWVDIQAEEERARQAADDKKAVDELRDAALRIVDRAARYRLYRAGKISWWVAHDVDSKYNAIQGVGFGLAIVLYSFWFARNGAFSVVFCVGLTIMAAAVVGLLPINDINNQERNLVTRALHQNVIDVSAAAAAAAAE